MRRLVALVLGTLLAPVACSNQSPPPGLSAPSSSSPTAPSAPTDLPPSPAVSRQAGVFFSVDGTYCTGVRSVPRTVPAAAPLRPALEQLFSGPRAEEQAAGMSGFAAPGLLRRVRVVQRRVYVDLVAARFPGSATTSCGGAAFNANLTATVRGIVPDAQVVVALDGDPKRFVEAQQGFCEEPAALGDRCDASGF